jgi:adenine C2-methylase RlmN of 23S rRNA A2503 and tRNA A37
MTKTEDIMKELEDAGYSSAVAVATEAEVEAGAACGQLAIINEED